MALPIRSHWLGTAPGGLLWFALWDCDQAFVLRLTHSLGHTLRHTHTQAGSAVASPVRYPQRPDDETLKRGVKRTRVAKNASFEDSDCDNYCYYQGDSCKKADVTTVQLLWLIKESRLISATALLGSGLFRRVRSTKSMNIIYLQTTHSEEQRPARC